MRSVSVRTAPSHAISSSAKLRDATRCVVERLEGRAMMDAAPTDIDRTFGTAGTGIVYGFSAQDTTGWSYSDITVLPDGKYLAAGQASNSFAVFRVNADGTPARTFGTRDPNFSPFDPRS